MQLPAGRFAFKARYLFPVESPPLADATLTLDGQQIVAIGQGQADCPTFDLGNVAILPGMVNAHTHLEFSDLTAPLKNDEKSLPSWIRQVVQRRKDASQISDATSKERAILRGLAESVAAGVTTLGEIATDPWPAAAFVETKIDCALFLELLGLAEEKTPDIMQGARRHLDEAKGAVWRPGLSPHAPYSVHPDLLQQACQLSAQSQTPLAMHLAESVEELELLSSASGPFMELLSDLNAWDSSAIPRGIRPLDYLHVLKSAHRALIIHGNFLNGEEIALLAANRQRMSVVYCPRTHAYFGHGRYPLSEMLSQGVNVALGTDSRASNPDLSLLAEMRAVARYHSGIASDDIVRMATLNGATALSRQREIGSLAVGKRADLAIIPLPQSDSEPGKLLLDSEQPVMATLIGGQLVAGQLRADSC